MSDIFRGSLLDVAGIFVAVMQERFKEEGLPWRWAEKYERSDDQDATSDAPAAIAITSAYAEEDAVRDALPRVVVSVPQASLNSIASGNRASIRTPDRAEVFTAFDMMPVSIECRGKTAGEASVVADVVRAAVACSRNDIRETFNFHDVTLPGMTEPRKQDGFYAAVVSFQVTVQVLWKTTPIAPRLQEIAASIRTGGTEARQIALCTDFTR
jgi:hypothetical protein